MINKTSNWLNRWARKQNLAEIKLAMRELEQDPDLREQFAKLPFREQWMLARDLMNLLRGKYQEIRMWGIVLVGAAGAIWQLIRWLSHR